MNQTTVEVALSLLDAGQSFAWLTILANRGSSPRHAGSSMLVKSDGSIAGTIGGGALEAAAIRQAVEAVATGESRLMDYTLTNEDSARLGMICGGSGVVLIDYVSGGNSASRDYFDALRNLLEIGEKGWIATSIPDDRSPGWTARSCVLTSEGSVIGDPGCLPAGLSESLIGGSAQPQVSASAGWQTYVRPLSLQGTAFVFGAGHCGEQLVPVLGMLGFSTVVIDDRAEFANSERFPNADMIVVPDSFEGALAQMLVDENSYIIIMTRGHLHDRAVLRQALRTNAAYMGMIGSRKKVADTFAALMEEGVSAEDLARVHAPIGLPITAETPEEIAISIAAELIQIRASRRS